MYATLRSEEQAANAKAIKFLKDKQTRLQIPGLQAAVVRKGRIVLAKAVGLANVEHKVPARQDTLFPINSATKSFTGVAVIQLVEDGKMDLETAIGTYLDNLPKKWQKVKVRQLLAHSSGLPDIWDSDGLIGTGGELEAWTKVKTLPLQSAPGTRFSYNQTNYALLARILDKQAGMPFAKFFAKRQFEPAGMKTTCLGDTLDVLPGGATPYSFLRRVRGAGEKTLTTLSRWTDDLPAFMRTAAGINSTAEEVAHWIIALQGGKLLSKPDSLKTLWSADTFTNGKANEWAMGWPIMRASPPHPIVGGLGGGRSAFFVYPDDDLAIVVLTNLVGSNPHTFMDDIAGFYLHRKGA